jgi:hypothetical protein
MKAKKHTTKERIEHIYVMIHALHRRLEVLENNNSTTPENNKATNKTL